MALGARSGNVILLVLRQGLGLAVVGAGIGIPAALAGSRLLTRLLFGQSGTDPVVFCRGRLAGNRGGAASLRRSRVSRDSGRAYRGITGRVRSRSRTDAPNWRRNSRAPLGNILEVLTGWSTRK